MRLSRHLQAKHHYITRHGISQEAVNRVLRPGKNKFGKSIKAAPQKYMTVIAKRELHHYRNPNRYQYQFYYAWDPNLGPWDFCNELGHYPNWVLKINRRVPPTGPRVRLVNINGEPIERTETIVTRKKKQHHKRRILEKTKKVQQSFSHPQELVNSFHLMDQVFGLLELHQEVYKDGKAPLTRRVHGPFPEILCRDSSCYQSCNFSRFVPVWLIYINALRPESLINNIINVSLDFDEVQPGYKNKNHTGPATLADSHEQLIKYQARVYEIIHSGYDIFRDTKKVGVEKEKFVDGMHIYTRDVCDPESREKIGYCPNLPFLTNSDYMADYVDPFVDQVKNWVGQHACVDLLQEPNYLHKIDDGQLRCKMTIEPNKPRLCYNARPLAGIMKKLPCKLDDLGVLLPLLQKGMYGCISDDKQGKRDIIL